jgi:hypothetical protein
MPVPSSATCVTPLASSHSRSASSSGLTVPNARVSLRARSGAAPTSTVATTLACPTSTRRPAPRSRPWRPSQAATAALTRRRASAMRSSLTDGVRHSAVPQSARVSLDSGVSATRVNSTLTWSPPRSLAEITAVFISGSAPQELLVLTRTRQESGVRGTVRAVRVGVGLDTGALRTAPARDPTTKHQLAPRPLSGLVR